MLVASNEIRLGASEVCSSLFVERAIRGTLVERKALAFDTRYAAAAAGKPEPVGHLFLMLSGTLTNDRGDRVTAPYAFVLADEEWERRGEASRTFRTDGERVDVVQLRLRREHVRVPIGMSAGALAMSAESWDSAAGLLRDKSAALLARFLDALARDGIVAGELTDTVIDDEPERFRRFWDAAQPLYQTYGATMSLKQLASSLGMSMRQVGRDAKELAAAFGISGYRDALLVLRLRTAVLLLSAPDAGVADVARLVGYGSAIAMARAFRDARLPPPSAVQAALRGDPPPHE